MEVEEKETKVENYVTKAAWGKGELTATTAIGS